MDNRQLKYDLELLLSFIDEHIANINGLAATLQAKVYEIVRLELLKFDSEDGKLIPDQDLRKRLVSIDAKITQVFGVSIWEDGITDFLSSYQTIEDQNVSLHRTYNQLVIDTRLLTPARRFIYEQAKYSLSTGIKSQYIQPVKFLLMQQVTSGASIQDGLKMLEKWNDGELTSGSQTNGRQTPNLTRYATQIARDSAYSVDRTINNIIKEKYELDGFMYAGGIVEDSRPLCVHLVNMNRPVAFDELGPLLKQYPQGLYPETTVDNFLQRCGGYACRHKAFAVRTTQP